MTHAEVSGVPSSGGKMSVRFVAEAYVACWCGRTRSKVAAVCLWVCVSELRRGVCGVLVTSMTVKVVLRSSLLTDG